MRYIIIILTSVFLTSCASTATKIIKCDNCVKIDSSNLKTINGTYETGLWYYIAPFKFKSRKQLGSATAVTLEVSGLHKIKATLIKDNQVIATKIIRGKIKDGYFSARPKFVLIPIPFIYFIYYSGKFDFSIINNNEFLSSDNKNDLYMVARESSFGWMFILAQAGSTNDWKAIYKRK